MADQYENSNENNTFYSLNTSSTKEENDFVDDKVHVTETVIIVNNFDEDYIRHDIIKQYPTSSVSNNIKEELISYEEHVLNKIKVVNNFDEDYIQHDKTKQYPVSSVSSNIKEELISSEEHVLNKIKVELVSSETQCNINKHNIKIDEGIIVGDIKIEFDNGKLYCEHCMAYYEDYCVKCGMLVHILNRNTLDNSADRTREELPKYILEIKHLFGQSGILALQVIPEGVKFGPFTGLCRTGPAWKVRGEKFVVNKDESSYLNWMQYINTTRNISEQNLLILQCEDNLYYRSTRTIQPGEELVVYFGEEFEDTLNKNFEVDFIPTTEHITKDVFACTFCSLGFSSKSYLVKHKSICLTNAGGDFSFQEITQCPFCKVHLFQKEYLEYHLAYCSKRHTRKSIPPTLSNQMIGVNGRKKRRSPLYNCEQCKYKTKYKANIKKHTNRQHYNVKKSKCGICNKRFKTELYLKLHMENTHISDDGKEDLTHSRCDYVNTLIKVERSNSQSQMKRFKCCLCGLRTKHKLSLTCHIKTKHLKKFDYNCDRCLYKTNNKYYLEMHIKTKHLKEFDYKCDLCEFRTNQKKHLENHIKAQHLEKCQCKCDLCEFETACKQSLERHIKAKHMKEFNFKCDSCEYRSNYKSHLNRHVKSKHLKEFNFKCDSCNYSTDRKDSLDGHIKQKHLKKFDYKCDLCEFKTNRKHYLERHIKSKHLNEFYFKCDACEFRTNYKNDFKRHIKVRHLKEFNFKCDSCEFRTNGKHHLEEHIKTKHLKEFDYKCDSCDYRTNRKDTFEAHIKRKHLNGFNFKCDTCKYGTNFKNSLETHIKTNHLKVFDHNCDSCEFRTNHKVALKEHIKRKH